MTENGILFYTTYEHENIILVPSISETILNKPQPPTPIQSLDDDLFYRLQKENARLPPQDSTAFILAQIERQNVLLEKDPKSIYIQSNELKAHFSTVQRLVRDNIDDDEDEEEIDWGFWEAVIQDSDQVALKLPHLLSLKLRSGIPTRVRGLMWQAMSKSASLHLEKVYEQLCKEKSPHERIIQRDLARTFPRIDMFKQENGQGQSSMKRILESYSLYDAEVGYCQGLAFLVGPLLMNMPEAQSFCVFVRLMETYEMRSMFTLNMEGLQLRLYQFSSLLNEILPELAQHVSNFGVHAAMYASQWFLTLFAYVFPINLVTRIYDIIFAEGAAETIMRVAIAMLKRSQSTILEFHEFEDILDFVTTKKLCAPYEENYTNVVRDAMALSDMISRDKMDALAIEYEQSTHKMLEHPLETGRFGFWKRKGNSNKKPDMRRSASSQDSNITAIAAPPVMLKKRWSSVSSRKDWSYRTTTTHSSEEENAAKMQDLKLQHQKTLNELLEMKYDKQDLECERDALKLTILELERCHLYKRSNMTTDSNQTSLEGSARLFDCDNSADLEGTRSFSDLAVASKEEENIISRQNSIHHSMLSSSSQSYTTTEFDDDDQISLSLTTTTVPIFSDEDELSSQIVHLKVKNFELEQHVEKLNGDVEAITSKFDMVNEGHMGLVEQLVCLKSEIEECALEAGKKEETLKKITDENEQLKEELEMMKKSLTYCRIENGVLNQDLEMLKQGMFFKPSVVNGGESTGGGRHRIRRHSTASSSMLTLLRDQRMHQLEQSLTAANIKIAEHEFSKQQEECGKKKSSIYGRVLHAIKYNS
ncbi:hypothetical protein INT47_004989 [Mucor saturninus]|uniref:Rab-GAP TBC domain-containing protein n=1 Tax=Mucor saturninus TaxID=64648 RepID=A0A8H7UXS6_9FUNG|nr:hypothetical protein INT47_004989 [Mucor saturninus]